jgi:uncharacterized protein YpiB (UPF0302 family)
MYKTIVIKCCRNESTATQKYKMDQKIAEMEKLVMDFDANKNRCIMLPD